MAGVNHWHIVITVKRSRDLSGHLVLRISMGDAWTDMAWRRGVGQASIVVNRSHVACISIRHGEEYSRSV